MARKNHDDVWKQRIHNDVNKTIAAMSQAINEGDYGEAIDIGEEHTHFSLNDYQTAHFWFQLSLAYRLTGDSVNADQCWEKAKKCHDYSMSMEGDFLGDVALSHVRQAQPEQAEQLLPRIRKDFGGDLNRIAKLDFIAGRILAAKGDQLAAVGKYQEAERRWLSLGKKANAQWLLNCRVHLIRAYALGGMHHAIKGIYQAVRQSTPSPNRKQLAMARAARYGGKLGVKLVDRLT